MGLTVALFAVVQYLGVRLPINFAGGSVSLGMLPIVVLALRRGPVLGMAVGATCGVVDGVLIEPYFVHWAQIVLDYPVAFGAVGLAGLMSAPARAAASKLGLLAGVAATAAVIGGAGRFVAHWASGTIFFAANAPEGQPAWLYSIIYNATYLIPSTIAVAVLAAVVYPALVRAVPLHTRASEA
jgi:thiamine transporter